MQTIILFSIFGSVVFGFVMWSIIDYRKKNPIKPIVKPIEKKDLSDKEKEFVDLVNAERKALGLNGLIPELLACKVCLDRNLEDISNNEKPSHDGWREMVMACRTPNDVGDQIEAYNVISAENLFNYYMISPDGHKDVLLKDDRTHIGLRFMDRRNYCLIIKH